MSFIQFYFISIIISLILILFTTLFWSKSEDKYKNFYKLHKNDENFGIKKAMLSQLLDENINNNQIVSLDISLVDIDNDSNYEKDLKNIFIGTLFMMSVICFIPLINIILLFLITLKFFKLNKTIFSISKLRV